MFANNSSLPPEVVTTTELVLGLHLGDPSILNFCDKYWFSFDPVARSAHFFVGLVLAAIGLIGVTGNALVLWVFTRRKRLLTASNVLIVNLAFSDLVTSGLHPMPCYCSFVERWIFGKAGCDIYAAGTGFFGLMSIVTLTAISFERFSVICSSKLTGRWDVSNKRNMLVVTFIWIYCLALMVPPLCGWGRFTLEGFLTSCSFDYIDRRWHNRSFVIYLFTFGFVVPVTSISFCYTKMVSEIHRHEEQMTAAAISMRRNSREPRRRVDLRTARIVFMLVLLFVVSWTPYALVTLVAQFGDVTAVTPYVSALPALFAKASTIYNPIVYGVSHPMFRNEIRKMFHWPRGFGLTGDRSTRRSSVLRSTINRIGSIRGSIQRRKILTVKGKAPPVTDSNSGFQVEQKEIILSTSQLDQ